MKWTKHPTNASTSNPIVNRLEEVFGIAGYAMFFKLQEVIGGHLEHKDQPPTVTLSSKQWAKLLKCRGDKLVEFFQELEVLGQIILDLNDSSISVTMPSIRESLDNRAVSSAIRASLGPLEEKKEDLEKKALEKEEIESDDFSFLINEDHDRLKLALSRSGKDAVDATAKVVEEIFTKSGDNKEILAQIKSEIFRHFGRNEKAKALGDSVWASAKEASVKGTAIFKKAKNANDQIAKEQELRSKGKSAPNSKDRICQSVMARWTKSKNRFFETDITFDELDYFLIENIKYWGEKTARSKFAQLFSIYED
ncbi:MAG: hypothetical protein KDD52_10120, partial [Bdellovibrionales bacterium]|nr:hypothetical protein [Bdellovibrionales bacterium]